VLKDGKLQDIGTPTRIYQDPATAFVAAFLGTPPIHLAAATIWVEIGERIIIGFGPQSLYLPWSDPRSDRLLPRISRPRMARLAGYGLPHGRPGGGSSPARRTPAGELAAAAGLPARLDHRKGHRRDRGCTAARKPLITGDPVWVTHYR
jgi:hypothetical protein